MLTIHSQNNKARPKVTDSWAIVLNSAQCLSADPLFDQLTIKRVNLQA